MSSVPRDCFIIQIAAIESPSGGAGQLSLQGAVTATDVECGQCCHRIKANAAEVLAKHSCAPFYPEVIIRRGIVPLLRKIPSGGIVIWFQDHYRKTSYSPTSARLT